MWLRIGNFNAVSYINSYLFIFYSLPFCFFFFVSIFFVFFFRVGCDDKLPGPTNEVEAVERLMNVAVTPIIVKYICHSRNL